MTRPSASRSRSWTPLQWLCLLIVAAIAAAGWAQAWKWRHAAADLDQLGRAASEQRQGQGQGRLDSSDAENPTVSLMGDLDLMRQVDLLTEENERLASELRKMHEAEEARNERAALDGTGGILR